MNKRNRVAEIAVRKLRRFGGREWCGYLTPAEVVYLLDKGCKLTETNKYKEELARTWFGSGEGHASWYYFQSLAVVLPNDLHFKP